MTAMPSSLSSEIEPELPSYTRRPSAGCSTILVNREFKRFSYKQSKRKTRPGISLTVSGDAKISKDTPSFMEGDKVAGSVRICANSDEDIRAVKIAVVGRVSTGTADGICTFLDISKTLWTTEIGNLEAHKAQSGDYEYSWPFSMTLPRTAAVPGGKGEPDQGFPLPHTFNEAGVPAKVYYELVTTVKLQSMFKRNRRMNIAIAYFQSSHPSERIRQLSDPSIAVDDTSHSSWKSLKPVHLEGTLFRERNVKLRCTLSLKTPLHYTRGSSIPLRFEMRSEDQQAVDLLSSPRTVVVKLHRRISYKDVQMVGGKSSRWSRVVECVGVATWKLSQVEKESASSSNPAVLRGKINLKRGLAPSNLIANMAIDYTVSLYPISSPDFQFKGSKDTSLASQTVEINTDLSVCPE